MLGAGMVVRPMVHYLAGHGYRVVVASRTLAKAQELVKGAPHAVAVESVFAALNVKTALKLAEMRGVVLLAAAQAHIPAHSYSPREVKASIAGFGGASKEQVQRMVTSILGLSDNAEPLDASDALAVALCHAHASRARQRFAVATRLAPPPARTVAVRAARIPR